MDINIYIYIYIYYTNINEASPMLRHRPPSHVGILFLPDCTFWAVFRRHMAGVNVKDITFGADTEAVSWLVGVVQGPLVFPITSPKKVRALCFCCLFTPQFSSLSSRLNRPA